jgi:hypothetical protein
MALSKAVNFTLKENEILFIAENNTPITLIINPL